MKVIVLLLLLILLGVAVSFGLRQFEHNNLYYPDRDIVIYPQAFGLPYEEIYFKSSDGVNLHGWLIPSEEEDAITILFIHGNGGNIGDRVQKAAVFHRLGCRVFLFDYRGYGKSEGRPSEAGTYADAQAAYEFLTQSKNIPSERIVFYGESLGGGVAVHVAQGKNARGLILESTFTSIVDMSTRLFPWIPAHLAVKNKYESIRKIADIKMPILIMHSPQDELVPFDMGQSLYQAATAPKSFVELKGSHNECFLESGETYAAAIKDFLK